MSKRKQPKEYTVPTDTIGRPLSIDTFTGEQFAVVIARERAKEFRIEALESLRTQTGKGNGAWRFEIWYLDGRGYPVELPDFTRRVQPDPVF